MFELTPHKTIFNSQILDSDSVSLVRTIMPSNIVNSSKLEEGGSQADTDGYLDICDEDGFARARITVQIKHLTHSAENDTAYYDIPIELYAYAGIHKGDIVVFIASDTDNKRLFWKYISLEDVRIISEGEKNPQNTYRHHFSAEEICSSSNVIDVLAAWKALYDDRMASIKDERQLAESFAILQRTAFNLISTELYGIEASYITRHQVRDICEWISHPSNGDDERICLLVGDAGVGKSAVLKKVIDLQSDSNKKYLCIKADAIDKTGSNVTLDKIRDTIEFFSVGFDEVILFIDQIDALSQCLSNDRNHLNVMMTMLSSLKDWYNVRAIVSCRNYDLNYDSDLFALKDKAKQIIIGELTDDEVSCALENVEKGLRNKLDNATFRLLRTVQYLNAFCILYEKRKSDLHFGSPTELYDALWEEYIYKTPIHIDTEILEQTLFLIADTARSAGTLRPVLIPTTAQKKFFDYLASRGLINIEVNTVTFFHQSFYEYILARRYTSSVGSLLNDFKDDFQGLELRSIVKVVLEYERDHNGALFVSEVSSILKSESSRLHIKLLAVSVLACIQDPQPAEKRLVKDICKKDDRLLLYFLRGVRADGWFATVHKLVKDVLLDLKKDNPVLFPIIGCLSNFVFSHPGDVFGLINMIADAETKLLSTAHLLRSHNDYRCQCVLDAYHLSSSQNTHYSVELIKDAFLTNEKFAFHETESLIADYLISEGKGSRHDGYELVDVLFPDLFNNRPKDFLLTLNNAILETIEKSSYEGYHGFTCTKAFSGFSLDDYTGRLLKTYEDLLVRFSSDAELLRPIIEKLMALRNETSVSMAFSAMAANPMTYRDLIWPLVVDDLTINKYFSGDVRFFYLKMLKSWYLTLNNDDAENYQKKILSYKSSVDFCYDKERRWSHYLCPHLWRDKWDLICNTLPEDGIIPEMKRCSQELLRRFGRRSIVERPNHNVTAAYFCGGVVSDETYSKWSLKDWLTSFLKLDENRGWRDGEPPISLSEHANAFKKCVTANPDKFRDFVREISCREDIKVMYKVAGVEGLLAGGDDPLPLWNLAAPYITVEYAQKNSYSFSQIAEHYIKSENPYLDDILKVAELLSVIPFERSGYYDSSDDDTKDISRRATTLLERAINSHQGRAVELLIHTCAIPERREQVYGVISRLQASFSEPLKTLPLHYLYVKDSFDESLYFPLMKQLLAGLGPEALFIRTDAIQWCFYHKNDFVKDYIDRIEPDSSSHEILSQIYFYGLSSEKNREECLLRLEKILSNNEENVIAKLVEVALKSYCHQELKEYAAQLLRRFASDGRDIVANAYCWYCDSLPVEAFNFYCDIAKARTGKKYREIHNQLEYVKKCISKYPKECYKFISDQRYSEIDGQWIADDDVVRVLLQIYNKLKEDEDEEAMNEIMDLFDEYIYRGNRMIMDAVEKMN